MILPASSSLSIVLGALAAETARRRLTLSVAGGDVPSIVAASVMAGESLAGIGWQVSHALLVR